MTLSLPKLTLGLPFGMSNHFRTLDSKQSGWLRLFMLLMVVGSVLSSTAVHAQDNTDTTITCVVTNNTVVGGTSGALSLSIMNLEMPISYQWQTSPPQTTSSITDLPKGVYPVIIVDANGYVDTAECSVGEPYQSCFQARTQTQGGWGTKARGGNPGAYRDANFDNAFPNGLVIGCPNGGHTITLTSSEAVREFLPQGKTPQALVASLNNPTRKNYKNVLSGQVAALSLSVGFDLYDPDFGADNESLIFQEIASGPFAGYTIEEVLDVANEVLGGCSGAYGDSEINQVVTQINENFVDGKKSGGFISCTPQSGGFIGDFVWEDLDGDGSWDSGEPGIPGVRLELRYAGADDTLGTGDDVIFQDTTDALGTYGFSGLRAGTYEVNVDEYTLNPTMVLTTNNEPKQVNLGYNEVYLYADFGYQRQAGVIGDRVWLDLNGNGLQEGFEPGLPGVNLILTTPENGTAVKTSAGNGLYLYDQLSGGTYSVAIDEGSIPLATGYLITTQTSFDITISGSDTVLTADFGIRPVGSGASNTASIGDQVWHDTDNDGMPDFTESGINNVILTIVYANFDGIIGTADDIAYPPAISQGNGDYLFSNLYPGVYQVQVVANVPNDFSPTTVISYTVTVSEGENYTTADFGFNIPPSSIGGVVWQDLDGDGTKDSGEPLQGGVTVELHDANTNSPTGISQITLSDGSYLFDNLSAGNYYVQVVANTLPGGFIVTAQQNDNDIDGTTFKTTDINLPVGTDVIRDAGIILPGIVNLELSNNKPVIINHYTPVTYTYVVTNIGGAPLASVILSDPDNTPVYYSGDSNNDGLLDNTETWIYKAVRTWTWTFGTKYKYVNAIADALDIIGTPSADPASTSSLVIGVNMELEADTYEASPGDTVNITMTTRMINSADIPDGYDAQLTDVIIGCNLISGGNYWTAGPASYYWADPGGDYTSSTSGAEGIALDADDYVDNDNGNGDADWIHAYTFVIPQDQAEDITVIASDHVKINLYNGSSWSSYDSIQPGIDSLVISIIGNQAIKADKDLIDAITTVATPFGSSQKAEILENKAYPNPFVDQFVLEIAPEFVGGKAELITMDGRIVQTISNLKMTQNVGESTIPAGMLMLRLSKNDQMQLMFLSKN